MKPQSVLLTACLSVLLVRPATAQDDGWRTIEFETSEVTFPDVTLSPDGEWLIFNMLGHRVTRERQCSFIKRHHHQRPVRRHVQEEPRL